MENLRFYLKRFVVTSSLLFIHHLFNKKSEKRDVDKRKQQWQIKKIERNHPNDWKFFFIHILPLSYYFSHFILFFVPIAATFLFSYFSLQYIFFYLNSFSAHALSHSVQFDVICSNS